MWSSRIIPSTPCRGNTSHTIRCLPTTTVIHVGVAGQSGAGRSIHEERVTFQSLLQQSPYLLYRPPPCRRATRVGIFSPSWNQSWTADVWQENKVGEWERRSEKLSVWQCPRFVIWLWTLAPPGTADKQLWTHQPKGGRSIISCWEIFLMILSLILCLKWIFVHIIYFLLMSMSARCGILTTQGNKNQCGCT